ncbi:MAG: YXWGXW repeat-containing protein [Bryobacteraceae bacterium]
MKKLIALAVLAAGSLFGQVSIGIQIGAPPPPRVLRARPVAPGAGYIWVDGYWYPQGKHYRWHAGYWTLAPYEGAYWIAPRYDRGMFFEGYWGGQRNPRFDHDHRWDRDRDRDRGRFHDDDDRDRDHGRGRR